MKAEAAAAPVAPEPPVYVLAPGRDGELSCRVLTQAGRRCERWRDDAELRAGLDDDAGALLLAEEALSPPLVEWLQARALAEPAWSDLPLIVVAQHAHRSPDPARLARLGNVTVLTRPMAMGDLVSAVASALRARGRQFQVRQLLRQQAEEARRKDDFLAMLAHELRNPLAPVRYAAHALRAQAGSPRVAQLTEVVERQVAHMGNIIARLLDVSRMTRGSIVLEREPLDFAELVLRCAQAHEAAAAQRGIRLACDAAGPAWVDGDATRLRQVVENLVDNAIKFSPDGGTVRLALSRQPGEVVLQVADEGDGIAAADLPFVFQPFVQADRSLERARGGLGLGLAMVKGVTELHGGRVEARSGGPGQGSRFRVALPLADGDSAATAAPGTPTAATGGLRVLLAEDNLDAAETLKMLLELSGYEVALAHSGPDAVAAARSQRPDVLLCDIGLPGMSGYEVARTLRADPAFAGTLLVAVTGYGTEQDRRAASEAGFDRHFAKPVDPDEMFSTLQQLGHRSGTA
ncbi:MAG: hybrid sensor histidine kinase/response regulator [Ramlibacter sp.]